MKLNVIEIYTDGSCHTNYNFGAWAAILFIGNNNLTVSCLEILNELKIKVPEDIAIVSYDDIELFKVYSPSITAVAQPIEEMCQSAVSILVDNINKRKDKHMEPTMDVLKSKLVVRQSCGSALMQTV